MVKRQSVLVPSAAVVIAFLASCQSSVTTQVTFARPYGQPGPTKVFVIESLFGALADNPYQEFQATMMNGLQQCGVSSEFYRIDNSPLALDTRTKLQAAIAAANEFGSDAILVVNETSKTTFSNARGDAVTAITNGHVDAATATYSFVLNDAKTRRPIWSARSTLQRAAAWDAGPKLAESALASMKKAAVLRDCTAAKGPA